ncbi:MAG: cupin domain-containing protein [Limisphaerales bacterium]
MKLVLVFVTLLAAAIVMTGAGPGVTFVGNDKVAASLAKGGMLVSQSDLTVQGAHRAAAGQVEVHDKETDVLYITDGEATFVTGGTMVGGKRTKAGQWLGTGIQGGESHRLTKGDVIVIPAGVPHWFKEVPKSVSYFVVKAIKQ